MCSTGMAQVVCAVLLLTCRDTRGNGVRSRGFTTLWVDLRNRQTQRKSRRLGSQRATTQQVGSFRSRLTTGRAGRELLLTKTAQHNELTYTGCGCAGGDVVTFRDERGRRRKLINDTLGRLVKVEELNWDQSVYSTTTYTYNARDQITQSSQAGQLRTFNYDPHGRLLTRQLPNREQAPTAITWMTRWRRSRMRGMRL